MAILVSPDFQTLIGEDGQTLICDEPAAIVEKLSLGFADGRRGKGLASQ